MKSVNYLPDGRNGFTESRFSEQQSEYVEAWRITRFRVKSHRTEKSIGVTCGQDIITAILSGFESKAFLTMQRSGCAEWCTGFAFLLSNYEGNLNMSVRNEIKAQIIRAGFTMQEVVDLLHDEYGWSDSVSNLSAKLQRESIRYKEVVELADALGYELIWQKRREK